MLFPLKDYKYKLPTYSDQGGFGYIRKYDIHTGIDLYCSENDEVYAMEDGNIINIEKFTGAWADSPWWNDTEAILIESKSGVILYGEIEVDDNIRNKKTVSKGELLGRIKPVLKKDKGIVPVNMLHLELYKKSTKKSVWWKLNEKRPNNLLDISIFMRVYFDN